MDISSINANEKKEIQEALSLFGLNDNEQNVYLELLGVGKITLTPLSRIVGLPLTTVQSILKRLSEAGLVETTFVRSRRRYMAKDPAALKEVLSQQQKEISAVIPLLKNLQSENMGAAKVKVYFRESIADILNQALEAKDKTIYEIMSAGDFQKIMGESYHFTKRRLEKGVHLKSLRIEEHEIKNYSKVTHKRELREAKFLPRELTFRSSIMFWDDTVVIFTTKQEGLSLVIESRTLRETYQQIFDLLWTISRPMDTAKV
ncbi:MAG: helix-turn-helix domain-containing protein [Candidatus Spechtbacterales bacterium]